MMQWRIYYDDGSTFDSTQGGPEDVYAFGVICIVYPDSIVGRVVMHGWDWYYWVPKHSQWWGSDIHGVLDRMLHRLPVVALCQGRNVHNKEYRQIMDQAMSDSDFPKKSAVDKREHP